MTVLRAERDCGQSVCHPSRSCCPCLRRPARPLRGWETWGVPGVGMGPAGWAGQASGRCGR